VFDGPAWKGGTGGREEKRADALRERDFTAEDTESTEEDEEGSFQLSVLSFQ
jgi:hypothetical protein